MKIFNILLLSTFMITTVYANDSSISTTNSIDTKKFNSVLNSVQKIEKKSNSAGTNAFNFTNYFGKHKNFINSSQDVVFLKKILAAYIKGSNRAIDNTITNTGKNNELYSNDYNYKTFIVYLKSIMFLSKNAWSVWLNDTKITNADNNKNTEFYIKNIDDKKIVLQWNISEFKWSYVNKMKSIPEQKYKVLEDGSVELILTLYPNQSYLPFVDQIIEGRYTKMFEKGSDTNIEESNDKNNNTDSDINVELEKIINSL